MDKNGTMRAVVSHTPPKRTPPMSSNLKYKKRARDSPRKSPHREKKAHHVRYPLDCQNKFPIYLVETTNTLPLYRHTQCNVSVLLYEEPPLHLLRSCQMFVKTNKQKSHAAWWYPVVAYYKSTVSHEIDKNTEEKN